MITPRAVALDGVGYGHLSVATSGFIVQAIPLSGLLESFFVPMVTEPLFLALLIDRAGLDLGLLRTMNATVITPPPVQSSHILNSYSESGIIVVSNIQAQLDSRMILEVPATKEISE